MKILFIYRICKSSFENTGVLYKLDGQKEALVSMGHSVHEILYDEKGIRYNGELVKSIKNTSSFLFKLNFFRHCESFLSLHKFDLCIVRYGLSDPGFLGFLKEIKRQNSKSRIVLDLPTYPYFREWKGLKGLTFLAIDRIFRKKLENHIDFIISPSFEKYIWGIPVLHISNGIQIEKFPLRRGNKGEFGKIVLITIGKWQFWHGLDRIILGIHNYVESEGEEKLELVVVGEGPALTKLAKLVEEKALTEHVIFLGNIEEEKLNQLFNKADLAIGTLGLHRKKVYNDSSLKHREYAARGIPFILSCPDDDFPNSLEWVRFVSVSDDPIDIKEVIKFCKKARKNLALSKEIRNYAQKELTWLSRMERLIQYYLTLNNLPSSV